LKEREERKGKTTGIRTDLSWKRNIGERRQRDKKYETVVGKISECKVVPVPKMKKNYYPS
jgi:hypothetical protein